MHRKRMGQRFARQHIDEGVQLYHEQKHDEAIRKWQGALRKLRARQDRFITLGYLAQAHCEAGNYREMLAFSLQQIDLANEEEDSYMRAEAYLNLARSNEKLAEYHKAISYSRHSLQNRSNDPRTPGYAYLCIGLATLGFSSFAQSLENFELAMQIANQTQDKLLELQICVGLGALFTQLKDNAKALLFLNNATELLESVSISDVRAKYKSLVDYHMSITLRQKERYQEAKEICESALSLAISNGNRPIQARCLLSLGDIYRDTLDAEGLEPPNEGIYIEFNWLLQNSWIKYEASLQLMLETADRCGQVMVLASMAKCSFLLKCPRISQCECQAIELNKRCLETARAIGCKMATLKCHARLEQIYEALNDDENAEAEREAVTLLVKEIECFCNFCGQRYGIRDSSLQALPCSHLFHERCLKTYMANREKRLCPKCFKCNPSTSTDV